MSLDYGGSTADSSYTPRVARATMTRSTVSAKTKIARSKRLKQIPLAEVNAKIRTAIDAILENDDESEESSMFSEVVAEGVPENLLNRIKGAFSAVKFDYEYDTGNLFIVKFVSQEHQNAVIKLSTQFDNFSEACNDVFSSSGGNTRLNLLNANNQVTGVRNVEPDATLEFAVDREDRIRIVFEMEYKNRSIYGLDERVRLMMRGWTDCLIGIGCKFFTRNAANGRFAAIALVYYKRNGVIRLARILDIGANAPLGAHIGRIERQIIQKVNGSNSHTRIETPPNRPSFGTLPGGKRSLVTDTPAFYQVEMDRELLFELVPACVARQRLIIDFFRLSNAFFRANLEAFGPGNANNESST